MTTTDTNRPARDRLSDLEHGTVETNGVTLHTVTAGPTDGTPVLLLHGFPEFWYGWRSQIPALTEAGYRVIVPDQRGYNRSEKPSGIEPYTTDEIAADAVGLLDAHGHDQVQVVGHDWGGIVTWQLTMRHPDRVQRAVTMNIPHPEVFEEFLPRTPSQWLKSWYMFAFQLPGLPEWFCRLDDWRGLRWLLDTANTESAFTESDLDLYEQAWSRPDALSSMINWYRALFRGDSPDPPTTTVDPPTMLVWGTDDAYLHSDMAEPSIDRCRSGRLERVNDATHWLQHEKPDRVNDLLLDFLHC